MRREALIVDVRGNRGGHTSQLVVEKLARRVIGWDVPRGLRPATYPLDAPRGPVVALDLHARKLEGVRAEAVRLGVEKRLTLRAHDATQPLPRDLGHFDAVLLDAPCSGLGTLRRNPELRYRRMEADIPRLAELQRLLLERAQEAVPRGGLLVYAVCSTEPEEGPRQLQDFLKAWPDFALAPPEGRAAQDCPLENGCLRTLPGPEGRDGFFAARLRRQ